MVKISIITVSFNVINDLKKTIKSVEKQFNSYKNIEHIIIDADSNDGTKEYLNSLNLPYLKFTSEKDNGIYDGMNKGIKIARGEFLLFLNAGDYIEGDVLSNFKDEPTFIPVKYINFFNKLKFFKIKSYKMGLPYNHQGIIFKNNKKILYNEKYKIAADYDYYLRHGYKNLPMLKTNGHIYYDNFGFSQKKYKERDYEISKIIKKNFNNIHYLLFIFYSKFKSTIKDIINKDKKILIVDPSSYTLPYDYYFIKEQYKNEKMHFIASHKKHCEYMVNAFKENKNINSRFYEISNPNKIIGLINYFRMIIRILVSSYSYRKIHFQWSIFSLFELPLFIVIRKKLSFTFHDVGPRDKKLKKHLPFNLIYKLSNEVIFVSQKAKDDFINIYKPKNLNKIKIIPHPLLPISPLFEKIPQKPSIKEKTIIFWGYVKAYKGIEFLNELSKTKEMSNFIFEIHGKWYFDIINEKDNFNKNNVKIFDKFLTDTEIYNLMKRNALFILPYKEGSQSGVLNTLFYYKKDFLTTKVIETHNIPESNIIKYGDIKSTIKKILNFYNNEL